MINLKVKEFLVCKNVSLRQQIRNASLQRGRNQCGFQETWQGSGKEITLNCVMTQKMVIEK